MKRLIAIIGVLILSIVFGGISYGATATGTLQVSATYVGVCTVSTTAVNFGNVSGYGMVSPAQGNIAVNCPNGVDYHIALDAGLYAWGGKRHLDGGGGQVNYLLYKPGGSNEWGDSDYANTYSAGSSLADTGNGDTQNHTVGAEFGTFVTFPAPNTTMTDTVTVTVHY